ncbi:MAG TPA: glycosyl hydrolase, partial [Bacillota bacterium]|nr:glycosyl hydrolase [Bacillota bacterium]
DNYAGHFRELAHRHGMRLSIEAYDANPCDDLTYAGRADEPMAEFWSWSPYHFAVSCTEMASAAHVYGRRILGAEAFTATDAEKWQGHPFAVKAYGDWAFCEGVNRFVFHRYALQPWTQPEHAPGMSMGPWGLHYERSQTWWEQSRAWHEYLARCQFLLRQGLFVADICYLAPEKSPQRWQPPGRGRDASLSRPAYNFDGCPPEVLFTRMSVKAGKLVLPDGMSYRVLVLPESETMTPRLLGRIAELVKAGATVIGAPPKKSPSLAGYPQCDAEVAKLAQELWGKCDGKRTQEDRYGKGRVIWGRAPEQVLAAMGVKPDFTCQTPGAGLRYIHRTVGDKEIYFVSSKNPVSVEAVCAFRAPGRRPELWWPDSGSRERVAVYDQAEGTVRVPLRLAPAGSVFVVFRADQAIESHRITSVRRSGELVLDTGSKRQMGLAKAQALPAPTNNFTMAAWAKPEAEISLPRETNAGVFLSERRNDALYPPPGHETGWDEGHAGAGVSVGRNGVCVYEHGEHYFAPLLVCPASLTNWTHVAVVYRDGQPSLYLNGQLTRQGLKSTWQVRSGVNVLHGRTVEPFHGALGKFAGFDKALGVSDVARLVKTMPREAAPLPPASVEPPEATVKLTRNSAGDLELLAAEPGRYQLTPAKGKVQQVEVVSVPAPVTLSGPWEVTFDPKWGGPTQPVTFSALDDWSKRPEEGIRFYS